MKCHMCGGRLVETETEHNILYNEALIVLENVPSLACTQCAEKYYSADVAQRIQETAWELHKPARVLRTPVFDFAVVCSNPHSRSCDERLAQAKIASSNG